PDPSQARTTCGTAATLGRERARRPAHAAPETGVSAAEDVDAAAERPRIEPAAGRDVQRERLDEAVAQPGIQRLPPPTAVDRLEDAPERPRIERAGSPRVGLERAHEPVPESGPSGAPVPAAVHRLEDAVVQR